MSHNVDDEIASLYQGESDAFLEGRKALAAKLKKAGDKEGAAHVAALAKPTPSAWATNRVSVTARHAFVEMLSQGARLRSAMRESLRGNSGQQVAALQREQRESIEAVVAEASRLLDEAKLPSTNVVMGRVRTNLATIAMTGRWGDAGSGRLSKDLPALDIGALAALLDELPDDHPQETVPEKTVKPATAKAAPAAKSGEGANDVEAKKAKAEEEKREQQRREKIRELEAELARAESLREKTEAALAKKIAVTEAAALSHSEAADRFKTATKEAHRLEALAEEAREQASRARRDADTENANLATAKRESDKASQEAARSKTHVLAIRERLDNAKE